MNDVNSCRPHSCAPVYAELANNVISSFVGSEHASNFSHESTKEHLPFAIEDYLSKNGFDTPETVEPELTNHLIANAKYLIDYKLPYICDYNFSIEELTLDFCKAYRSLIVASFYRSFKGFYTRASLEIENDDLVNTFWEMVLFQNKTSLTKLLSRTIPAARKNKIYFILKKMVATSFLGYAFERFNNVYISKRVQILHTPEGLSPDAWTDKISDESFAPTICLLSESEVSSDTNNEHFWIEGLRAHTSPIIYSTLKMLVVDRLDDSEISALTGKSLPGVQRNIRNAKAVLSNILEQQDICEEVRSAYKNAIMASA